MSISEEIQRIKTNIENAYISCESKGATLPQEMNSHNLATTIDSITGGGSGETIEVLNKTGAVINEGDKVWLSENYQGEVSKYLVSTVASISQKGGCIDRTGTFGAMNNKGYNIGDEEATFVYNVSGGSPLVLCYGDDNSILTCAGDGNRIYRIDGKAQFALNPNTIKSFCSKYLFTTYNSVLLRELNMTTGEYVKRWTLSTTSTSSAASSVVIDNTVYTFSPTTSSEKSYYADLPEESGDLALENKASIENYTKTYLLPLGITADNKYIVMANGSMGGTSLSGVTLFEVLGKGQLKELSSGELPTDLQPYYSVGCHVAFNPYTGVLTAGVIGGTDYVIMKYENGEWSKLPIEITLPSVISGPMTVSDDLSKACVIVYYESSKGYCPYIFNLPTTQGYSAIAYNTRNITDKTITATALAESQPNELAQVQIGSVTNEDLTVTENGTYTPSATYTGFGSVNVNVKGAEKIEAVNKTGSSIAKGDKVWVNENYQGEVSKYVCLEQTSSFGACIDRTGTFGVANGRGYNIGDEEATYAYNVSGGNPKILIYADDNSILTCAGNSNNLYRIDGKAQFTVSLSTIRSICSKYLYHSNNNFKELNMITGEIIKSWSLSPSASSAVVIDNTIYTFSSTPYYADLPEESGSTITLNTKTSIANYTQKYVLPLGITTDNKYIVMANGSMSSGGPLNGVTLFEVLGKGQLKELSSGELPTDLQPFYSVGCQVAFNPYTGVLTADKHSGTDYVIMKYENGEWTKVAVDLPLFSGCTIIGPITLSDDLTRACFMQNYSSSYYASIYNLPTTEGYGAIAYNTRNITENTITGYAMTDAEPNETVTVSVPAEV